MIVRPVSLGRPSHSSRVDHIRACINKTSPTVRYAAWFDSQLGVSVPSGRQGQGRPCQQHATTPIDSNAWASADTAIRRLPGAGTRGCHVLHRRQRKQVPSPWPKFHELLDGVIKFLPGRRSRGLSCSGFDRAFHTGSIAARSPRKWYIQQYMITSLMASRALPDAGRWSRIHVRLSCSGLEMSCVDRSDVDGEEIRDRLGRATGQHPRFCMAWYRLARCELALTCGKVRQACDGGQRGPKGKQLAGVSMLSQTYQRALRASVRAQLST